MVTRESAEKAVKVILEYLEGDPDREGLEETPKRVIDSFDEIFAGYQMDPAEVLHLPSMEKGTMELFY